MAFKIGRGVQRIPFPDVLDATFLELLVQLVDAGALVSVGASRDGGAVSVTVTCNGEWDREWFRTDEELHEWLTEAVAVVSRMTPEPPSAQRPRRAR